jgi:hypothetical protein
MEVGLGQVSTKAELFQNTSVTDLPKKAIRE